MRGLLPRLCMLCNFAGPSVFFREAVQHFVSSCMLTRLPKQCDGGCCYLTQVWSVSSCNIQHTTSAPRLNFLNYTTIEVVVERLCFRRRLSFCPRGVYTNPAPADTPRASRHPLGRKTPPGQADTLPPPPPRRAPGRHLW